MTIYAVISKATGLEVYRYNADAPTEFQGMAFDVTDHIALPDGATAMQPTQSREWSVIDFLRCFHLGERIAARERAKIDPIMADFLALMEQSPAVHSNDADVVAGLYYMQSIGILESGRIAEILGGA